MEAQKLSLHHLLQMPEAAREGQGSARYPAVLALHGRGSNEQDLIGLAPYLPQDLLWIAPRAPLVLGPGAYEWYRIQVIGRPEPAQVLAALETIDRFIDEIFAAYPIDPERFFLLGFSQGSILSMCYTLSHPARIAGVIAQSGYIPEGIGFEIKEAELRGKPFVVTHGTQDTVLPVEWDRASRDLLQSLGVDLSYHEFPMGHNVSMESLEVVSEWLEAQLRS